MDEKATKKIVDKLAEASKFDADYAKEDRGWFITKVINVLSAQGVTDADIQSKVTTIVSKAKTFVKANGNFKIGVKLDKDNAATERASRGRRVEILYGLIATDPGLLDTGNTALLTFVAKRRYRSIERMALFVNPNGRGYFRYPNMCPTNQAKNGWHWKINKDAEKYWEPLNPPVDIPIWMKNPPTAPASFDPVAAVRSLFTQKSDPCEGNLLDCATTMNVILMDSLLEGSDPKAFMGSLTARNPIYLSIIHVNPPVIAQPETFFLTDPSDQGLFNKGGISVEDLQVGDHVYIRNHELYKTLRPTGSWSGEHALVTDCGNRDIQSDKGFKFMGHGMPHGGETGAIPRFYKGLLNEINTYLYRSYRLAAIFLNYLDSGKTSIPASKVQHDTGSATADGKTFTVDYYFFDIDFHYLDFMAKPPKDAKVAKQKDHGFVVGHAPSEKQFILHHRRKLADAKSDGVTDRRSGVLFAVDSNPDTPPKNEFDPVGWILRYLDASGSPQDYTLFKRSGGSKTLSMVSLDMNELYTEPLGRTAAGDVFTTRARVSLDSTYLSFLKTAKAIPP